LDATPQQEPSGLPNPLPSNKDRSGGLLACGVIEIIIGALAALAIPLVLLAALLARKTTGATAPAGSYFLSVTSYAVISAVLITLGIGSIRAQTWARALNLIVSWIWLAAGILMTILITAVLPAAFRQGFNRAAAMNANTPPPPMVFVAVILTFMIVLFAVFLVVLPLVFVLFFGRKDVEETCRRRDPVERWTDRCPLPVLALSLMFASASPYYLLMSVTFPMVPFFGKYLTGIPGGLGCVVLAGLDAFLAFSLFRLQLAGWWIAMGSLVVRSVSAAITFGRGDLLRAYSRMGWKQPQLDLMNSSPLFRSGVMLWWGFGFTLIFAGYLLWTKRYFAAAPIAAPTPPEISQPPADSGDRAAGSY